MACSSTNWTCRALRMPLLMFKTWEGSSGWARISVMRPPSILKTRSWAWSSSANAVDPWDMWYSKGPGFLLWASQSSTVSIYKRNGFDKFITCSRNRFLACGKTFSIFSTLILVKQSVRQFLFKDWDARIFWAPASAPPHLSLPKKISEWM